MNNEALLFAEILLCDVPNKFGAISYNNTSIYLEISLNWEFAAITDYSAVSGL